MRSVRSDSDSTTFARPLAGSVVVTTPQRDERSTRFVPRPPLAPSHGPELPGPLWERDSPGRIEARIEAGLVALAVALACLLATAATAAADDRGDAPEPPTAIERGSSLADFLAECDRLVSADRLLEARTRLVLALRTSGVAETERAGIRRRLEAINDITFFSPRVVSGDPFTDRYVVEPGDTLARIAAELELGVDWRLLRRVNGLGESSRVRAFAPIKVVRGPFHARVSRRDYRLDLYAGPPESPEHWLYVRSLAVGLGEGETTPTGSFVVARGGKVVDPFWTDPRTGTWYAPGAEDNPIGDRWIGLDGVGASAALTGYGLHGTVDPDSIGEARSMGCVRLLPEDVRLVFELLTEGTSRVVLER